MTRQGKLILEVLRESRDHLTADEVYDEVKKELPNISLATVYRNLEKLVETGDIQRAGLGGSKRRYDARLDTHYHIRCLLCGGLQDLPITPEVTVEEGEWGKTDYDILGHELEFVGVCPECRKAGGAFAPEITLPVKK